MIHFGFVKVSSLLAVPNVFHSIFCNFYFLIPQSYTDKNKMEAPTEPKVEPINPFLTYEAMRTYTDTARFIALVDVAVAAKKLEVPEIKSTASS